MESILYEINLQQIIHFITVVEHHGFQTAGIHLHMTQSAISKSIGRLEDTLGFPLFSTENKGNRQFRSAELTSQGRFLYKYWSAALSDIENAYQQLALSEASKKTLDMAYAYTTNPADYFWPLITKVMDHTTDFTIRMESRYRTELIAGLLEKKYDMICIPDIEYFALNHDLMSYQYIAAGNVMVLVSSSNPLYGKEELSLSDIQDQLVLVHSDGKSTSPREVLDRFFRSVNMTVPTKGVKADSFNLVNTLLRNDGLIFVDEFINIPLPANLKKIPLRGYYNGILCVWMKKSPKIDYIKTVTRHFPNLKERIREKKPFLIL